MSSNANIALWASPGSSIHRVYAYAVKSWSQPAAGPASGIDEGLQWMVRTLKLLYYRCLKCVEIQAHGNHPYIKFRLPYIKKGIIDAKIFSPGGFSLWGTTERVGFEPTVACTTSAFEADALDHYATSPYNHMQGSKLHEQGTPSEGFEPPTLPLGRACSVQLS